MQILSYLARRFHLTSRWDPSLTIRDISYISGPDVHVKQKLDIFLPSSSANLLLAPNDGKNSRKKVPIIVHIPGGGWARGDRTNEWHGGPTIGRTCAKEGFLSIVVSYRLVNISLISFLIWSIIFGLIMLVLSSILYTWQIVGYYIALMIVVYLYNYLYKVRVPVSLENMVDDVCHALVYVRDHISEHYPHADTDQVFLSGHSAGAHLVSLLILDKSYFQRHKLSLSIIRGVIVMSGIYSLSNPVHDSKYNIRNLIFRIFYTTNFVYSKGKTIIEYSPIEYIKTHEDLPAFLVMSAQFDMGLEIDAQRFVERLRKYNHQVEYHTIGRMTTHGTLTTKFFKNDAHRHFFTFIRRNIRN